MLWRRQDLARGGARTEAPRLRRSEEWGGRITFPANYKGVCSVTSFLGGPGWSPGQNENYFNPFNASCSRLLLFETSSARLV